MMFVSSYNSPLGELLIFADAIGITDLCFVDHKSRYVNFYNDCQKQDTPILLQTKFWLDDYFSEIIPTNILPLHLHGTVFQKQVWQELLKIPYGATTTYGNLAKIIVSVLAISVLSSKDNHFKITQKLFRSDICVITQLCISNGLKNTMTKSIAVKALLFGVKKIILSTKVFVTG